MGLLDDAKDKIGGLLHGHEDQAKEGVDKVADVVADKVGEEHAGKVEAAADKVKDVIDDLGGASA